MAENITITQENAFELIEKAYWSGGTIFSDPPYISKREALYQCFFTKKDHRQLAYLLDSLHHGYDGADILLTYDYCEWLERFYNMPEIQRFGKSYSI
jgi:DNA adenine methylase